jgi:hypothetical protein
MLPPELRFLLLSSRTTLDEADTAALLNLCAGGLNWNNVLSLSLYHGTAPLAYHAITASETLKKAVPEEILGTLKNYYYANLTRTLKLWKEFCDMHDNFKARGIPFMPLKGIVLGNTLYHNPALRSIFADIDILIRKNDAAAASMAIKELGYNKASFSPAGHIGVFRKGQFMVELHYQFFPPGLNKIDTETLWERSRDVIIDSRGFRVLSWEDNLLTLTLQIRHDWPEIKIFRFCDINEILAQHKDALDWEYLVRAGKKNQIKNTLGFAIYAATVLLNNKLPRQFTRNLLNNSLRYGILLSHLENHLTPDKQKPFSGQVSRWYKTLLIDNPVSWTLFQVKKRMPS